MHNPEAEIRVNLIYPPLLPQSQTGVVGGAWNCQSAVKKADFISVFASYCSHDFLARTETWMSPKNSGTPAALSSAYAFSHTPWETGRGGGTVLLLSGRWCFTNLFPCLIWSFEFHSVTISSMITTVIYRPPGPLEHLLEEMDTLLRLFSTDKTLLTLLRDFNLPIHKLQSSCLLFLLYSFSLTFNSCSPSHKGGNALDLVFSCPYPATAINATLLHISNHHMISFTITLLSWLKPNTNISLPLETSTLSPRDPSLPAPNNTFYTLTALIPYHWRFLATDTSFSLSISWHSPFPYLWTPSVHYLPNPKRLLTQLLGYQMCYIAVKKE